MDLGDTIKYFKGSTEKTNIGFVFKINDTAFFVKDYKENQEMIWKNNVYYLYNPKGIMSSGSKECYDNSHYSKLLLLEKNKRD